MKATIISEDLNKWLSAVGRVVANKGQLPILANVLIEARKEGVELVATNLEMGMRVMVGGKVTEEGSITIPAKNLAEFVATLGPGNVDLNTDQEKMKVKCGRSEGVFTGISATEFPVVPRLGETEKSKQMILPKAIFEQVAAQVAYAAASDESRPVLTGIQFKTEDKKLLVTATDGFRLARKKFDLTSNSDGWENGMILPARSIGELARLVSEGKKQDLSMEIVKDNNQVIFGYDKIQLTSRVLEGNFPEVEKIIPSEHKTKVVLERESLMQAVRAAAIFARESSNIIRFGIDDKKFSVSARAQQTGESEVDLEAKKDGEDGEIAFNYRYVLDFLNSGEEEMVKFEMSGNLAPGVFGWEKDDSVVSLIMPVRVQG